MLCGEGKVSRTHATLCLNGQGSHIRHALVAQFGLEHILGKNEVMGSNPIQGSGKKARNWTTRQKYGLVYREVLIEPRSTTTMPP